MTAFWDRTLSRLKDRAASVFPWAMLLLVLVVGLPLFLSLPLWTDVVHYDICARRLFRGGAMYRDVIDNNLPGMIWAQTVIGALFGWRVQTLRIMDLGILTLAVVLLLKWIPERKRNASVRIWVATVLAVFYLFTPETCHCQRDCWMLLPSVVALRLRDRQLQLFANSAGGATLFRQALLEGLCWGAAFWIKPFVAVPALACWVVSVLARRRNRSGVWFDAAGLIAGGLIAGSLGLAWLAFTGSWHSFWEILLVWNREYASYVYFRMSRSDEIYYWLEYSLPWALVLVLTTATALTAIHHAVRGHGNASHKTASRALLGAFSLGYLVQAVFIQFPHSYVLAAAVFPAVVFVAGACPKQYPPCLRRIALLVFPALVLFITPGLIPSHLMQWPRCWSEGGTPELWDQLTLVAYAIDWQDLARVATFLRAEGLQDGELICLSGCTHPLPLMLNLEPCTRYNHVNQALHFFPNRTKQILSELAASRPRYVVSDLVDVGMMYNAAREGRAGQRPALPPCFPRHRFATIFPWYEPLVFRSGRYVVHRVTRPITKLWLYEWGWPKVVDPKHVPQRAPG